MAVRHEHGSARAALPRSKDLAQVPASVADCDRPRQRDDKGRFLPGNAVSIGRGWRSALAKMVGRDLQGEAAPLAREAWRVYRALLAEMPHTGAGVSALVAARARSAVLSARFAARAAEIGLDSQEGQDALRLSMQLDARAERLAISALDIATRLVTAERKVKPMDAHAAVLAHFNPTIAADGGEP